VIDKIAESVLNGQIETEKVPIDFDTFVGSFFGENQEERNSSMDPWSVPAVPSKPSVGALKKALRQVIASLNI
jgi:hypothetical protein